ncbi:hypothetical protein ACFQ3W_25570 [Paenibacillus puldeungensis]|uniref:Uncharacterized protein n=1 Tax=Paenibacillus puldeungensis TaxID=696536 RepID=A0ABW3S4C5_9BACL
MLGKDGLTNNDQIQEIKRRLSKTKKTLEENDLPMTSAVKDREYLISEVERLQEIVEAQGKVIESYQRIEKDMESDYVQVLELIKKNELCTHMRKTGTYKLAESALSHLKG